MTLEAIKAWLETPVPYAFPISVVFNILLVVCVRANRNILKELAAVPILAVFMVTLPMIGVSIIVADLAMSFKKTWVMTSVSGLLHRLGVQL